jgi:hypothetical protein
MDCVCRKIPHPNKPGIMFCPHGFEPQKPVARWHRHGNALTIYWSAYNPYASGKLTCHVYECNAEQNKRLAELVAVHILRTRHANHSKANASAQ